MSSYPVEVKRFIFKYQHHHIYHEKENPKLHDQYKIFCKTIRRNQITMNKESETIEFKESLTQ